MLLHQLADGQNVFIRPIEPGDKTQLQDGLKQLSVETIRRRFLASKPRFSSTELRYLTEVDGVNHIALVAVSADTGRIIGVARAVRLADDPETAEWAIVVGDAFQNRGLGRRLVEVLADRTREVGIRRFTATVLGENAAVFRLLAHVNGRFERDEQRGGVRELLVELAAA